MSDNGKEPDEGREQFRSRAESGADRFLAEVIVEALRVENRTAKDFIRHFPPAAIMSGLADEPTKRAHILVNTVGVREKIALRKSAASAGEDLQIALDEGETSEADIVGLFDPDDRVAFLERTALWKFVTEGQFWNPSDEHLERSKALVAFVLDCAIANGLVTHEQVVVAATVDTIAVRLPRRLLGEIIGAALAGGGPFTEQRLLELAPPASLVKHIQLDYLWNEVVLPRVAREHGFEPKGEESKPDDAAASEASGESSEPAKTAKTSATKDADSGAPAPRRMDSELPMSGWSQSPPAVPDAGGAERPAEVAEDTAAEQDAAPAEASAAETKSDPSASSVSDRLGAARKGKRATTAAKPSPSKAPDAASKPRPPGLGRGAKGAKDAAAEQDAESAQQPATAPRDGASKPPADLEEETTLITNPSELLDAVDDDDEPEAEADDPTTVMQSPLSDHPPPPEAPYISEREFERARSRSKSSRPGGVTSGVDLYKSHVIQALRRHGIKLPRNVEGESIRDVVIAALLEVNPTTYRSRLMELTEADLKDAGNVLCVELERKSPSLARGVRDALVALDAATKLPSRPPRARVSRPPRRKNRG
jgi:hypothetical protein